LRFEELNELRSTAWLDSIASDFYYHRYLLWIYAMNAVEKKYNPIYEPVKTEPSGNGAPYL